MDDPEIPLTVGGLIEALGKFPADTPVFTSGEFTQAVSEVEGARVTPSDTSLSGYECSYDAADAPNAVLLT